MTNRKISLEEIKIGQQYFANLRSKINNERISSLKRMSTEGEEYEKNIDFVYFIGTNLNKYGPSSLDFLAKNGYSIHQSVVTGTSQLVVSNMGSIYIPGNYDKEKKEWLLKDDNVDQAGRVLQAYEEIFTMEIELKKQKRVRVLEDAISQFGISIE